ncbi:MAG TPA: ankyrin repeat domain-containing protein [Xanthobacteraceae bacterium]|jgi:uncharacterized protein|nr:ankyrin repeat domain-containing protein [Xanthobacteraceae bacterium]
MTTQSRSLPSDTRLAVELTATLKRGDVEALGRLLASDPELARCSVEDPKGGRRTTLHIVADWPGHIPNAAPIVQALVAAGADVNAAAVGKFREAPLHWAASSDDVALIDALLDAGADIEQEGSSIDGGPPLSCAVGYGQWAAARRLVERGAQTHIWHEAALGLMPALARRFEGDASIASEDLSGAFWNACHGGQLAVARYLLAHGAELNWSAPWSGQTPLDIAEKAGRSEIATWLLEQGATRGTKGA